VLTSRDLRLGVVALAARLDVPVRFTAEAGAIPLITGGELANLADPTLIVPPGLS
jgi:hypothetical protein